VARSKVILTKSTARSCSSCILIRGAVWIRPGIAYWRGLDKPLAASTPNYNSFQLDIPFVF